MALRLRRKKNPGHVECEPGFPCPQLPLHYENWRLGVSGKNSNPKLGVRYIELQTLIDFIWVSASVRVL